MNLSMTPGKKLESKSQELACFTWKHGLGQVLAGSLLPISEDEVEYLGEINIYWEYDYSKPYCDGRPRRNCSYKEHLQNVLSEIKKHEQVNAFQLTDYLDHKKFYRTHAMMFRIPNNFLAIEREHNSIF